MTEFREKDMLILEFSIVASIKDRHTDDMFLYLTKLANLSNVLNWPKKFKE